MSGEQQPLGAPSSSLVEERPLDPVREPATSD